ncbi:MAG: sulfotransferase family protein [Gammaproteobacteria bacterium]
MMQGALAGVRRLWRGAPVIVVSGLPRSGTSMVMSMLGAGGLPLIDDGARAADDDNPRGYFEHERVMSLAQHADRAWLRQARGKGIKIISHLLKHLPAENDYRIVLVERALPEVVASQNRMLANRGEPNPLSDAATADAYARHLIAVRAWALAQRNCRLMALQYRQAVACPREAAARLNGFVGGGLDVERMAAAVDAALYRNRGGAPQEAGA